MLRLFFGVGLGVVLWARMACAESLTLSQAVQQALQQNPRVLAARQRIVAAQGRLTSARSHPHPDLFLNPLGVIEDSQLTLEQRFEVLNGKRTFRAQSANATVQAAQADLRAVELAVTADVTQAYFDLLLALRAQQLTEEAVKLVRALHEAAQKAFDAGDVPRTHVVRTRIELTRAEGELVRTQSEVDVRRAALNTLLARDPATSLTPADELRYEPRNFDFDVDGLKRLALQQRPEAQTAQFALQGSQSRVKLARAERLPDLAFQFKREKLSESNARAGLGLVLPLFDFGRIRGATKAARAEVAEQSALLMLTQQQIVLEVETAYRHAQAARQLVESYEKRTVPDANDLMQMVEQGYRAGGVTLLDVIDAQRTLSATRLEYAQAIAQYRKSLAELERAVGGQLPTR